MTKAWKAKFWKFPKCFVYEVVAAFGVWGEEQFAIMPISDTSFVLVSYIIFAIKRSNQKSKPPTMD